MLGEAIIVQSGKRRCCYCHRSLAVTWINGYTEVVPGLSGHDRLVRQTSKASLAPGIPLKSLWRELSSLKSQSERAR